jgi:hypothetical protein
MDNDGTFHPKAVEAYGKMMMGVFYALQDVLVIGQDGFGDIQLPDPNEPGAYFTVGLNAEDPDGFNLDIRPDDPKYGWTKDYVRRLFAAADVDPKALPIELCDAGCTFGGAPGLSVVPVIPEAFEDPALPLDSDFSSMDEACA